MACVVVLNGKVYVGGGYADRDEDQFIVQVYTPERDGWSRLPKCPLKRFSMVVVNQQLVVVGGDISTSTRLLKYLAGSSHSNILVWDTPSQQWTTPYPNMPTTRWSAAAVGYQHFLVVAGGYTHGGSPLNTIEVLNTSTKRWYTAAPFPAKCSGLTPAVVGDTLYLLGGLLSRLDVPNKQLFSTSLPVLVSHATSTPRAPSPTWELADSMHKVSTAVSLYGSLLAVGGEDSRGRYVYRSAIYLYNPQTKGWTKVGDVPTAMSKCSCTVLPSGELVVLGGWGEDAGQASKMYIALVV